MSPLLASSNQDGLVFMSILGAALTGSVCGGMVFLTGSGQGKVMLGVIGGLLAFGFAVYSWFGYSLPFAVAL